MPKIILFSHQAGDIPIVISLYENYSKKDYEITIVCVNVKNNYRYFNRLNLKVVKIFFIPSFSPNLRNPLAIIRAKLFLRYIFKKHFKSIINVEIFFFAKGHDWITFYIINRLIKRNNIVYYSPVKILPFTHNKNTIKNVLSLIIFNWLCNAKIKLAFSDPMIFLIYNNPKIINISLEPNIEALQKYKLVPNINKKTILLLDCDYTSLDFFENYPQNMLFITSEIINLGFELHIKAHPKLGFTPGILKYSSLVFPNYIPGEFIEVNKYSYIVSIMSSTSSFFSKYYTNVVSLINLFEFKDEKLKTNALDFLNSTATNRLIYINSTDELRQYETKSDF
ncbi:MAG: hypothetical protein ABIJ97_13320 [Bacteroidota bacterium]